jgi:hypothetical protein
VFSRGYIVQQRNCRTKDPPPPRPAPRTPRPIGRRYSPDLYAMRTRVLRACHTYLRFLRSGMPCGRLPYPPPGLLSWFFMSFCAI